MYNSIERFLLAGLDRVFKFIEMQVDEDRCVCRTLTPMWNEIDSRAMNPDKKAFNLNDFNTIEDVRIYIV